MVGHDVPGGEPVVGHSSPGGEPVAGEVAAKPAGAPIRFELGTPGGVTGAECKQEDEDYEAYWAWCQKVVDMEIGTMEMMEFGTLAIMELLVMEGKLVMRNYANQTLKINSGLCLVVK